MYKCYRSWILFAPIVTLGLSLFFALPANATQRVLLYQDAGTSPFCVEQTYAALLETVSSAFRVELCDANTILNTKWETDTALLVIPGGRSLPYHQKLDHEGTERIRRFVEQGGKYLGLCAGGYFGASQTVFYPNHPTMEIFSQSLLNFYPGVCQGPVYTDFAYQSEVGAHAAPLDITTSSLIERVGLHIAIYNNGGGAFIDSQLYPNVEVLARYTEMSSDAAIVACTVGQGLAILTGVHPEFNIHQLDLDLTSQEDILEKLTTYEPQQRDLWTYILQALGVTNP